MRQTTQSFQVQQNSTSTPSAVVLGGSLAGIWTARVLVDHFSQVTIVERDELPATPEYRPGVPQARQYHILLRKGLQIMQQLFPGVDQEVLAAGGVQFDEIEAVKTRFRGQWLPQYPSGNRLLSCSRIMLEATLREHLRQYPRVKVVDGAEVIGLTTDAAGQRVTGVRIRRRHGPDTGTESKIPADFVVDATGRNSHAPDWLDNLGYPTPEETVINPYLGYVSRRYRQPAQRSPDWQMMYILSDPPDQTRAGLIFPEENDTWVVMMAGANKDYPPTDEEGFDAYARSLDPEFYAALQSAEPLTRPYGYRQTANRWRHYESLSRRPDGFVVVGDAFCSFNPVYGQGMTVSAMTAVALGDELCQVENDLRGVAGRIQARVAEVTRPVWLLTTGADLEWPLTNGATQPKSLADRFGYWYIDRVMDAVPHDEQVRRAFLDVNHLVRPATDLFAPGIAWRVFRHAMRGRRSVDTTHAEMSKGTLT